MERSDPRLRALLHLDRGSYGHPARVPLLCLPHGAPAVGRQHGLLHHLAGGLSYPVPAAGRQLLEGHLHRRGWRAV